MRMNKRTKWDDGVAHYEEVCRHNKYITIVYIQNKAALNFKNRDFIEKRVYFKENGVYYIYITFVPDEVILLNNLLDKTTHERQSTGENNHRMF